MLVSEWLQIRSMHGILINYFTLWTTLGDLEKTIYIDIHGKSCAQWASTEETTHSTTHVQPHKMYTDKDLSQSLSISLSPSLSLCLCLSLSPSLFLALFHTLSSIIHRHNICGQICKKAVFKTYFIKRFILITHHSAV